MILIRGRVAQALKHRCKRTASLTLFRRSLKQMIFSMFLSDAKARELEY